MEVDLERTEIWRQIVQYSLALDQAREARQRKPVNRNGLGIKIDCPDVSEVFKKVEFPGHQ
jgi:hypothetical protein